MALSHLEARAVLVRVLGELGHEPTRRLLQALGGIASLESYYGKLGNNWGSIQCVPAKPPCAPGCMELQDRDADGNAYRACYRTWPTPEDGARDYVKNLMTRGNGIVRKALENGTPLEIAQAMKATGYFEAKVSKYAASIADRSKRIAKELAEPYELGSTAFSKPSQKIERGGMLLFAAVTAGALWVILRARKG